MDEPCGGTLRFSGHWILTNVFVTQADILASALSTKTSVQASPTAERSPTDSSFFTAGKKTNPIASAECLVPAIVGARTLYQ